MRDCKRILQILKRLEKIWKKHPDLRLGQLLGNAFEGDPYYVEDGQFIETIENWYKERK